MPAVEENLQFWRNLRELVSEVRANEALRDRFIEAPSEVIRERQLDVIIPEDASEVDVGERLSIVLDRMGRDERSAMLDAFASATDVRIGADIGRVALAVPIANVNVAANHNVAANTSSGANAVAVANALATANTTGAVLAGEDLIRPGIGARVTMPEAVIERGLQNFFDESRLNAGRQAALVKRALLDPASLISEDVSPDGLSRKTAQFMYRGTPFEVTADITDAEITVTSAKLLR